MYVCVYVSEQDSLILELCRQHGPSFETYSHISQTLKCRSTDDVCPTLHYTVFEEVVIILNLFNCKTVICIYF